MVLMEIIAIGTVWLSLGLLGWMAMVLMCMPYTEDAPELWVITFGPLTVIASIGYGFMILVDKFTE